MAGLFGFESLLGGNPDEINKTYGVPQGIVNNANADSMIGLGGLLMAAGQRQTPQQRAQLLSQLGSAVGAGDRSLYTGAQSYLMGKKYQDEAGMADYRKKLIEAQTNYYNNKGDGHWATASELPADYKGPPIWMGENGPKAVSGGGTNLTIDNKQEGSEATELGKEYAKQRINLENAANAAPTSIARLNLMQNVLDQSSQGPLAGVLGTAGGLASQLGISAESLKSIGINPNQATTNDIANKINSQLVKDSLASGEFPQNNFSDADRKFLTGSYQNILNMPGANRAVMDIMVAKHQYDLQKGSDWEKYQNEAEANGQRPDFNKFQRKWRSEHADDNIFAPVQEKLAKGAYGNIPNTGTPANTPRVLNKAQYDALPPSSQYIDPEGNLRTKGGK